MKVLVMPADLAGCGYYRLIWASEYLQQQGHDITILYPRNKENGLDIHFRGDYKGDPFAEIVDVVMPVDADVLVMQRASHNWHSKVIDVLRSKGVATVMDMDDDLSSIHPLNQGFHNLRPKNARTPTSWRNVEDSCKAVTLVTVSTKALLGVYARHGRGYVFDNYVPERYLNTSATKDKVFAWPGTTGSHPNDLQVMGRAIADLVKDGYNFRVVGPVSKVKENLRLADQPEHTGVVTLGNWASELVHQQLILAPLASTQFNTSKSRLKVIEASAVGVPWVASPRAEYRRFHAESKAGILAETPKEWYKAVKQLMDDPELCEDLGQQGQEYMRTQTIEGNAWRLWEAWEKAYDIEHGRAK